MATQYVKWSGGGAGAGSGGGAADGGVLTVANIGSAPSAAGASISGTVLTLQPADATRGGVLTAAAQTIGGAKTLSGGVITPSVSNAAGTSVVGLSTEISLTTNGGVDILVGSGTAAQSLRFFSGDGNNFVALRSPTTLTTDTTFTWPDGNGTAGQLLSTTGSGSTLAWASPSAGGGTPLSIGSVSLATVAGSPVVALNLPTNVGSTGMVLTSNGLGSVSFEMNMGKLFLNSPNGHGSTATTVRRFRNITENTAQNDFLYTDSASQGASIVITRPGIYSMYYNDTSGAATSYTGWTLNASSADLTLAVYSIAPGVRLTYTSTVLATTDGSSVIFPLRAGDTIRPQTDGSNTSVGSFSNLIFCRII